MIIIGIDPGTSCGWAVRYDDKRMDSGVWDLKPKRHEGAGFRWVRLRAALRELFQKVAPQVLAYEEVVRHVGTQAAQIYGGCVAIIQEECEAAKVPYVGVPVGTVKKMATGKGNANKDAMMAACASKWGVKPQDDNEADARWIAETAAKQV